MITYGTFTPVSGTAIILNNLINTTIKYVRVLNNTPLHMSVTIDGFITEITEFWQKDIQVPTPVQGNLKITPSTVITSTSHSQANQLTVQGLVDSDGGGSLDSAIPQQSVNITATGKPIFSATFGSGGTVGLAEYLNIFNPANSGVVAEFHSARCFTNDTTSPTCDIFLIPGADRNFATAVNAVSHTGIANPPVSVMHCTWVDSNANFDGTLQQEVEVQDQQANVTQDMIIFPDTIKLYPGNNFQIGLGSGSTGHIMRITVKWTEDTIVPPLAVLGPGMVANAIVNDNNPIGTSIIEATPQGAPQALSIFNDGHGVWAVDQSGVAHQVFKFNTAGNPLQQGQSGDVMEFLGQMLIAQLAAFTGEIDPNKAASVTTGSVSGTLRFNTAVWGSGLKIFVIDFENFNNAGATTLLFPSTANVMFYYSGNIGAVTWQFFNGVTGLTARHMLTLGAVGAAGTDEGITAIRSLNIGQQFGPMDRISMGGGGPNNSIVFGIGV